METFKIVKIEKIKNKKTDKSIHNLLIALYMNWFKFKLLK